MTRKRSVNKWGMVALYVLLAVGILLVWSMLAGGILLAFMDGDFNDATPVTLLQYAIYYRSKKTIVNRMLLSSGLAFVILALPVVILLVRKKKQPLHGNARFAARHDIAKAGLLGDEGLIVGKLGRSYLLFAGQQHVLMSAPTRSGKGVGVVIPNLLSWPHSVVVLDIKLENWDITSGYRHRCGQECYLFNPAPANGRTHRYNPLAYVRDEAHFRVDDVQKIATMLFPDSPDTDRIWTATPRSLFTGLVLYLMETPGKPVTFGQLVRESLTDEDAASRFRRIIAERKEAGHPLSSACARGLESFASIDSDNTRSGVMASFLSRLELWLNPLTDSATSGNDFDLRDLRKKRMSVYVGITPDNLARMAPLINLFFQQLIDLNTRELPSERNGLNHPCLLLMDEFTSIGKVNILAKGIAYIAGYGLRMMPIIQNPAQLAEVYGREAAETFRANHALHIIFPPKASETSTARDISEWLGYTTVKTVSESKPKGLFAKGTPSQNTSEQRRALMLPQEVSSMGEDKALVVLEDTPPILAEKVRYYDDPVFTRRLDAVSKDTMQRAAPVPQIKITDAESIAINTGSGSRNAIDTGTITPRAQRHLDEFALGSDEGDAPQPDLQAMAAYADTLCREAGLSIPDNDFTS